MEQEITERLHDLESRHNNLKRLFAGIVCLLLICIIAFGFMRTEKFDVIRAKGIIIEDENNRERILIGAPIPFSKDRVRTDTSLVRKYWANQFRNPNQYMKWYKDYKNTADGIVFLNETGFDVVQVGDNLSDPNIGKRMFKSTGIIWNTQTGWERGGAGVNTADDGTPRPTIGLDDNSGEAIHMVCLDDGSKAIVIGGDNGSLRIGMAKKEGELFETTSAFTGIQYFDNKGKKIWEQNMAKPGSNLKPKNNR